MNSNKQESARKKRKLSADVEQEQTSFDSPESILAGLEDHTYIRGDVWMDDGNLIIYAGQTQFRVHKSMLSRCSSVFTDMFSLPQPLDSCETLLEGCHVVHVYDSAADMTHLLSAIYEQRYSGQPLTRPVPRLDVVVVSALLRLANKYDIPLIRRDMAQRIHADYPSSFAKMSFDVLFYIEFGNSVHVDIVNLIHQEGLFSALPLALFYVIKEHSTEEIFNGFDRKDGQKVVLHPSTIAVCMTGKEKLLDFMWKTSYKWLRNAAKESFCGTSACRECFEALLNRIWCPSPRVQYALDPYLDEVISTQANTKVSSSGPGLCTLCKRGARKRHDKGRQAVFENLPFIFGLESWSKVMEKDRYQL